MTEKATVPEQPESVAGPTSGGKKGHEQKKEPVTEAAKEVGGPRGLEPTRYGDWERKGIASDF